jgi:cell volume regulation protein A
MVKELGLPREALISVIVRSGEAVLPRGSTVIAGGDELHVLVRRERHGEISRLIESWREGPLPTPPQVPIGVRGSPAIFSVRPTRPDDGDTGAPETVDGIEVALTLRTRPDVPAAVVVLADGRFAVTGPDLIAVGGRRTLSRWCTRRARSETVSPQDRAWLQEAIGTIDAPDLR